jgi:hypothetical protein
MLPEKIVLFFLASPPTMMSREPYPLHWLDESVRIGSEARAYTDMAVPS